MTMTLSSKKWLFLCAIPLAACGGGNNDAPTNVALAATGPVGAVCSTANENGSINLACPAGQTIASVQFASYGTPSGSCGSFEEGTCSSSKSMALVSDACVGKPSCSVVAGNGGFGDPCVGTLKHLYVQAQCSGQPAGAVCASAAENATLALACPSGQTITSVAFASYGTPRGTCGAYQTGVCNSASSSSIVSKACVGKSSCSVVANNDTFGDPCIGTAKQLYVQAGCGVGATGSGGAGGSGGQGGSTTGVTTTGSGSTTTETSGMTTTTGSSATTGTTTTAGTGGTTTTGAGGSGGTGGTGPTGPTGGTARPPWNTGKGFYVVGNKIYDANGVEFRMRGVNNSHWWTGTNEATIPYIAKSNANTSRAVFGPDGGAVTPAQHEAIVRQYIAAGVVPVVDFHNATCGEDPAQVDAAVNMWIGPDKAWLQSLEKYVIVNITNEWGPNSTVWRDAYKAAVAKMRQAGVKNLIMIDAGGACGQLAESVESWGKEIFDSDPEKNIVFSIHQYGFWVDPGSPKAGTWDGHQPYDIDAELTKLEATGVPIIIGEFSWQTFNQVTYTTRLAVQTYEKHGIGWLAWMWNNPSDATVDMSSTNVYNSSADLTDFGKMLIEDPALGMKANAKKATIF